MKPKTVILLVVALTCGLGASYMTSKLLAERKGPPPEERVPVLVAKASVAKYAVLSEPEKVFEVKFRLKSEAPASYFSDLKEIKDKRVNKEFKDGFHISPEDVSDKNTGLPIPDGLIGYALPVTAAKAVSFFVAPGARVDINWTERGEKGSSRTLMRHVLVVSVGSETTQRPDQPANQAPTVNLAVKREDASRLSLAEQHGDLRLLLCKEGDEPNNSEDKVITLDDLKQRTTTVVKASPPLAPAADPNKLPFGLGLNEIEKKPEQKEPEAPKPIEPVWKVTIERGAAAPQVVPFYRAPDGTITREDDPALDSLRKPAKAAEKKQ